jgi:hypothetical protein
MEKGYILTITILKTKKRHTRKIQNPGTNMKIYIVKIKENQKLMVFKTISALLMEIPREKRGVANSTLCQYKFDAKNNYRYENEKILILQEFAMGMAEVMMAKLGLALAVEGLSFSANSEREVTAKGYTFMYRKGFMLKDKSQQFESIEEILKLLK